FMKIMGWANIGAKANSTAFMGPTVDTGSELAMLPIGFFTNTLSLDQMVIGQNYTVIEGDSRHSSGSWGFIDYNANGGAAVINEAWVHCGFNPVVTTGGQWTEWADSQPGDCSNYDGRTAAKGP